MQSRENKTMRERELVMNDFTDSGVCKYVVCEKWKQLKFKMAARSFLTIFRDNFLSGGERASNKRLK